jgi:hypothetical protein
MSGNTDSGETWLTTNDAYEPWQPDFDLAIRLDPGFQHIVLIRDGKGGWQEIEVTADQWRDAATLLGLAEKKQMRAMLHEEFDADTADTVANLLRHIAGEP